MKVLKNQITSFSLEVLYSLACTIFSGSSLYCYRHNNTSHSEPDLFTLYDDEIAAPIEALKVEGDEERNDFLEAVSIMAWALYRAWRKADRSSKVQSPIELGLLKPETIYLFLENVDCPEGRSICERISQANASILR